MLVKFEMIIISRSPVVLLLSCAVVVCHLFAVLLVECAPSNAVIVEINSTEASIIDGTEEIVDPVKYDGAQLWRIPFHKQYQKNVVADLQNSFGKFTSCSYCVASRLFWPVYNVTF